MGDREHLKPSRLRICNYNKCSLFYKEVILKGQNPKTIPDWQAAKKVGFQSHNQEIISFHCAEKCIVRQNVL